MNKAKIPIHAPPAEWLIALIRLQESSSLLEAASYDTGLQSLYSHYLNYLSESFQIKLTERHGRNLRLTASGRELARIAREQMQAFEAFRQGAKGVVHEWSIGSDDALLGGIVIPALAKNRRRDEPRNFRLLNLPTAEIGTRLMEGRLEFGLMRRDELPEAVTAIDMCVVRHVALVPQRLVPRGGALKLESVLNNCPLAAVAGDDRFIQQMSRIARSVKASFRPELLCNTLSECMAAVRTGSYAAVVPSYFVDPNESGNFSVLEDENLRELDKRVALAWNPVTIAIQAGPGGKMKDDLIAWIRGEAALHGIGPSQP